MQNIANWFRSGHNKKNSLKNILIGNLQIKDVYRVRLSTASMLGELVKIGEIEREEEWKRVQEKGKRERELLQNKSNI